MLVGGGGKKRQKRTLIIALTLIELLLITFAIISYNNKTLDKYIFGSSDLKNTNLFAIMIEDENGEYKESSSDTFPGYEYFYNQTKSSCMDNTGKPIADSLLYNQDTKTASIIVSDTSSCYLYFDNWKTENKFSGDSFTNYLITEKNLKTYTNDNIYRFVGLHPDNYICFGTYDKNECLNNMEKYLYRIVGVFPDENEKQHLKLIKYSQLSMPWQLDNTFYNGYAYKISDINRDLNGSGFLTNTVYNYMQDSTWNSKIVDWTAYEGLLNTYYGGPDLTNTTPNEICSYGMSVLYPASSSGMGIRTEKFTSKIFPVSMCDYVWSMGNMASKWTFPTDKKMFLNGWIHQGRNSKINDNEWTMTAAGIFDGCYGAIYIDTDGSLSPSCYSVEMGVRPNFYLTDNIYASEIKGTGTNDHPYIFVKPGPQPPSITTKQNSNEFTINFNKGTGNLTKYCINSTNSLNNCEWKNVTTTSFVYTISSTEMKKLYIYLIDDTGCISTQTISYGLSDYLIKNGNLWQSGLEGDGYRYVGTGAYNSSSTPSNFVCFGTDDKSTCTSNPDDYMYRIIGVFDNKVNLIKLTSLSKNYIYDDDAIVVSGFYHLDIASSINNKTLYSYMQDNHWYNMLSSNYDDTFVDTSTVDENGPNYYNSVTPTEIYLHETNRSTKSNTKGSWDTTYSLYKKISLMRASDYVLSLGETAKSMTTGTYSNRNTLKTSWLFLGNNRYGNTSGNYTTEQLFARAGEVSGSGLSMTTYNWTINASGYLNYVNMKNAYAVRPVFFLEKSVISTSGTGTYTDPYILDN